MKTRWLHTLSIILALGLCSACAPTPLKPERMPGQVNDPGRLEDAAAEIEERAGNKEAAKKHRDRAIAQRHECNLFTFLASLIGDDPRELCRSPTEKEPVPQRLL